MNMFLELPDDLGKQVQQRAGVEAKTLSSWITELLRRELRQPQTQPLSLAEILQNPATRHRVSEFPLPTTVMLGLLYDEATADRDLPLTPRSQDPGRALAFP